LLIGQSDLRRIVLDAGVDRLMDEVIDALALALADPAAVAVCPRGGFALENERTGVLEWMPAMRPSVTATVKMVAYNPDNPDHFQLPTIMASTAVYDSRTGALTALLDATFTTALRTGAASAVATRRLARAGSSTVGLVGCGAQAVAQLHALSRVLPVRRVLAYDPDARVLASFPGRVAFTGLAVEACDRDTLEAASDVICTATSAPVGAPPVLVGDLDRLRPGLHVNAVGSDLPGKAELPLALLRAAVVCPDYLPQAAVEGECQQLSGDEIGPSLAELVAGEGGTDLRDRLTVFDSTGYALEDQVVTEVILGHARRLGAWRPLPLFTGTSDARNPYWLSRPDAELPAPGPAPQALTATR
jgi:ornithine cyclodeaminase/alanine dehydrogenase-like protein (mu-crystallin family)